jgi:hypothetical protein
MKEHSKKIFRIPLSVPSEGSTGPRRAKTPRRRVVFPIGFGMRNFTGQRSSVVLNRVISLKGRERRRLEDTWMAVAAALSCVAPGCVKGIPLGRGLQENYEMMGGIRMLYKWILKSWVSQGGDWVIERIKAICDWSQYYATLSDYDHPELPSGTIGAGRDGWLDFPWARGPLSRKVFPTRGPRSRLTPEMAKVVPIEHDGDHFAFCLYEIYSIKGALPGPSPEVCVGALRTHHRTLTSTVEVPEEILRAAFRFGREYRRSHEPDPKSIHWTTSGSAILESSRSQGGRSTWLQGLLRDTRVLSYSFLRSIVMDCSLRLKRSRELHDEGLLSWILYDIFNEEVVRIAPKENQDGSKSFSLEFPRFRDQASQKEIAEIFLGGVDPFQSFFSGEEPPKDPLLFSSLEEPFFPQRVEPKETDRSWNSNLRNYLLRQFLFDLALKERWVPQPSWRTWGHHPEDGAELLLYGALERHYTDPELREILVDDIIYHQGSPKDWYKDVLFQVHGYMGLYACHPEVALDEDFSPRSYSVKPSVVEEQGAKARVITISPGVIATLLHLLRTYCFSSLKKDPEVGSLAGEGTLIDWMRRVNGNLKKFPNKTLDGKVIVSLDLSRATDTFSQDLCKELLEGFITPKSPTLIRCLVPLATLGVSISYPKEVEVPDVGVTSRGILMGNPSSWFLLNMFTRYFWELSGYVNRISSRVPLERVLKDITEKDFSRWALEKFPDRDIFADPLTNRCGDDQISLCSPRRAMIFERLLPLGGGILSPGVHLRSESFGIFTKQLCCLDRVNRKVVFVDILRARQLSTPDSRLPRKKEMPPSWSRGAVASKETSWWTGPVRESALTFLHWRYHGFLSGVISLGLEPYLPKVFGGLEYPHYLKKPRIISGKTKRMLSILLRNDLSVDHLWNAVKLGGLWNPIMTSGKMAGVIEGYIGETLGSFLLETQSFESLCVDLGLTPPPYPDTKSLYRTLEEARKLSGGKECDWMTFEDFVDEMTGYLYEKFSWKFPAVTIDKVPSLRQISKMFHKIRQEILESDPYEYQPLKISDMSVLLRRLEFKKRSLIILDAKRQLRWMTD